MALGTAIHTAVLEPDEFEARHPVAPTVDRRTKAGRTAWDEFRGGLSPDQQPLSAADRHVVAAAASAIWSLGVLPPAAAATDTLTEVSMLAAAGSAASKCRLDAWDPQAASAWDVKSTADPSRAEQLVRSGWWLQAAHYASVAEALGVPLSSWGWIVVGTTPPHEARLVRLSPGGLEAAQEAHAEIMLDILDRESRGDWSSPTAVVDLPPWTFPTIHHHFI